MKQRKSIIERYLDYRLRLYIFKTYPGCYIHVYESIKSIEQEYKTHARKPLLGRMLYNRIQRTVIRHTQIYPENAVAFLLKPFE